MGQFQKHSRRRVCIPMGMSPIQALCTITNKIILVSTLGLIIHDNSTVSFLSGRCWKFIKIILVKCPWQAQLTCLYFSIMWKMVAMVGFSITAHTQQRNYDVFIVLCLFLVLRFRSPMQEAAL